MTLGFKPRTALGQRLMAIRERAIKGGMPMKSWGEIEVERAGLVVTYTSATVPRLHHAMDTVNWFAGRRLYHIGVVVL